MMTSPTLLTSFLDEAARIHPASVAVQDRRQRLTFGEMQGTAARIAALLSDLGVVPGDRVALCMANSAAFCAVFWGVLRAGAVAVPLHPETRPRKLSFIYGDCTPKVIVADEGLARTMPAICAEAGIEAAILINAAGSELDQLFATDAPVPRPGVGSGIIDADLAAIIYTSGSTGDPKGVMLSHLNMTSAARSVAGYLGYDSSDSVFCSIPMTFDYGLHQLTMTTLTGASLFVEPSFAQPLFALQRLAKSRATIFPIVPTMVPLIAPLADRFDLGAVRTVSSTSAALHGGYIDTLAALFPAARIFSMYGLTECHRCTYLDPAELSRRKASVGKAIPNTEMWVVDAAGQAHRQNATGELVIRGSTVMKGYWRNPEKTAQRLKPGPFPGEMVLYTGDTCRLDEDGFLYFISRSDDILKVAGEKVAPSEVDAALVAHPAVAQCCAFGVEHPVYGQQCVAAVVLKAGHDELTDADLGDWCTTRLEPHSVPARIWITAEMPRNGNNKIDRHLLRERFLESVRPEISKTQRMQPSTPAADAARTHI